MNRRDRMDGAEKSGCISPQQEWLVGRFQRDALEGISLIPQ